MKFITCLLVLMISGISSMDAQKKLFDLHDLIPGGKTNKQFAPANLKNSSWAGDTFVYQNGDTLISVTGEGKKDNKIVITLEEINKSLQANDIETLEKFPAIKFPEKKNPGFCYFINGNNLILLSLKDKTITQIFKFEDGDNGQDINPNFNHVAVCNGNNLFVVDKTGERFEISDNLMNDIVWGQSVHRNEFGIEKGTYWSPDGKKLAFYRMDESMVEDYPLVDVSQRQAAAKNIKYPMAGMTSHEVTIGVYNTEDNSIIYLETGEPADHYLTNISWTPDSKEIYVAELNRDQNHMDLNVYDSETGYKTKKLFEETSNKYVEPQNPAMFIPGSDSFIWISNRDGFDHIYLYDRYANQSKQLTSGKWVVTDIVKIDKNNVWYISTETGDLNRNLYKVNIKTGKRELVTPADGVHSVKINNSSTALYDRFSSHSNPGKSSLLNLKTKKENVLVQAEDPYKEYQMPSIRTGVIKAADDSTDLYYRIVEPADLDPDKKYPVVVYLYNGPHLQLIRNSWLSDTRGWDIYMAQKGYIVFSIDGRGSYNRGRDFEQAIHLNLGKEEGKDQMKGIEYLKTLPYVDQDRIGIHGWSYGGFMTTNMMLTYPETFKVGVAGGPVIDWKYYEIMYGERYMGHPDKNIEGYAESSLLNKAGNLQGRLLMIHGDMDPVVVLQHSLSFLQKCVEENVYPDYFIYPGHEHNVRGIDRVHLMEKITRYFDDFLK